MALIIDVFRVKPMKLILRYGSHESVITLLKCDLECDALIQCAPACTVRALLSECGASCMLSAHTAFPSWTVSSGDGLNRGLLLNPHFLKMRSNYCNL